MPKPDQALIDRIDERLQVLGISDRKASLRAVNKADAIRDIRRGSAPSASRLADLARALETSVDYLLGKTDVSVPSVINGEKSLLPGINEMPKDIPVYGTAIGADAEYTTENGSLVAVEQVDLNQSEVIDRFRRPPALRERRDIYGLYVAGGSMEPAFDSGRGILIDPKRPPAIRDYVIVYRARPGEHPDLDGLACVMLKRLVRRSATFVELEQFNPPALFRIPAKEVAQIHRVMPWDEAFGL